MGDYKKFHDNLTNAALASPLAFIAGGPVGAGMTLGLGVLLDHLDNKDFERRQKEWENNPHRVVELTPEQKLQNFQREMEIINHINNLPHMVNAIKIFGCPRCIKGGEKIEYITTSGGGRLLEQTPTGIGDGEVIFHKGSYDYIGYKRIPATLYCNAKDFLVRFDMDYKKHQNIKIYRILSSPYKEGRWMYTIDQEKSFIVGL